MGEMECYDTEEQSVSPYKEFAYSRIRNLPLCGCGWSHTYGYNRDKEEFTIHGTKIIVGDI